MPNETESISPEADFQKSLQTLKTMDAPFLAQQIAREHPQTIALIISTLSLSPQAVKTLKALPEHLQNNVAARMLKMAIVPPDVSMEVIRLLMIDLKVSRDDQGEVLGGVDSVVRMLEQANDKDVSAMLLKLEKSAGSSDLGLINEVRAKLNKATL